ncbi:SpoIIE family protein phosphatase [Fluviispira vulneris]|uniref:SpoIIE family protein phosphatase n=1 Tax=Fluviispira vulneris TaxID=2763012 RepID=UPI0016473370|nr:SpoIIE family protein phosphatase [Fluviispira vulneris]
MITEQDKFSEIINISGRQRMLSQRITLLCYCNFNNIEKNKFEIKKEIIKLSNLMRESNIYLEQKETELGLQKATQNGFHDKINYFINSAIDCATNDNCKKFSQNFSYNYISNLLSNLNKNVENFSQKSKDDIQRIIKFSRAILIITLLTLLVESLFIFRPLVNQIVKQFNELEIKNKLIFETNKKLEFEMNAAKMVMGNLLPKVELIKSFDDKLDLAYYYQSAVSVGGDLWGIYKFGNKKMILIGDVTGHGAGSAVIASAVSGFMESVSTSKLDDIDSLKKIYIDLSNFINKIENDKFFMTMGLVIFDEDLKSFSFINAAHNFPFLVDYTESESWTVKRLVLGGYRLGNKIDYSDIDNIKINTYEFTDKTILILFTDGLVENMNDKEIPYGENNIKKIIKNKNYINFASSILMQDIIENAYIHYNGKLIEDDVTLVVIKKNI